MKKRKIPLGTSNFKKIIQENYYYCDKTKLIDDILEDGFEVNLFTRPRRFGKTLNMSMLRYFFDVKDAEENRELFKNLDIKKSENFEKQGQYPVIFISFKDLTANSWEEMKVGIKELMRKLFSENSNIIADLTQLEKGIFNSLLAKSLNVNEMKNLLQFLSELLYKYHNKKVVLLIDEYDTPIISAFTNGYYKEAISFFKTFYSSALKDNDYLELGVITGILQVARENIFSGLNNITVHSILDEEYSSYFGFLQDEVSQALIEYELKDKIEDVKLWYDGYRFGNSEVYNPWSILNYLYKRKIEAFWVNTSSNDLITQSLQKSEQDIFDDLKALLTGGTIEKPVNKRFKFEDVQNISSIWELFVFSGYLKLEKKVSDDPEDDLYLLKLPNREVRSFFSKSFIETFLAGQSTFREMLYALKKKDIRIFEARLQTIFKTSISYYDLGQEEKYYHNLLLGMILTMQNEYTITSNREDGHGRYDILVEPKDKMKTGFILELKVGDNEEELEQLSLDAIEQIKSKEYSSSMKAKGVDDILAVGIAFHKKKVKAKFEQI